MGDTTQLITSKRRKTKGKINSSKETLAAGMKTQASRLSPSMEQGHRGPHGSRGGGHSSPLTWAEKALRQRMKCWEFGNCGRPEAVGWCSGRALSLFGNNEKSCHPVCTKDTQSRLKARSLCYPEQDSGHIFRPGRN